MWAEVGEGQLIGPDLVQDTTEKMSQIKDRLKGVHDRKKSYTNKRRKPPEFSIGDYVLLKVSPWKDVVCFRKKGKLAPRFVGPFEIVEKVGLVAYQLDLPEELNGVHETFHVSNLKKCLADLTLQSQVDAKLNFVEELVEILETEFKKLKRSRIDIVKVQWNSKRGPEFTWEHEDQMKLKYPYLFSNFTGELTLLKSIPPGIEETDYHPEEEIRLTKRLLYDNSSPRPPKEFVSDNSNADIKSFSPSPIPIKDSDSHMEEIDLSLNPVEPNSRDLTNDVVEDISPTKEP
nr:putative reverse transcriptase domain-containing protein [Tanacetum cinerariifolium]